MIVDFARLAERGMILPRPGVHVQRKGDGTMSDDSLNLLQGTLDILVLKALVPGPRHGYGVARWIRETTEDTLQIEEGALYTALHRLEKRSWLEAEWGLSENNRKAKFYRLTPAGEKKLRSGAETWARYAEAIFKVLGAQETEGAA